MHNPIANTPHLERNILEWNVPEDMVAELSARVKKIPLQLAFRKRLRGFSARNMRNMRIFFEEWTRHPIWQTLSAKLGSVQNTNCQSVTDEIWQTLSAKLENSTLEVRQPVPGELGTFNLGAFLSIGFAHHMLIIAKCKTLEERLFYIRRCATEFWSYRQLQQHIRANEFATDGNAVNNFALTIPDDSQVGRAVQAFRSEYLLDFVNIDDLNETEE